MQTRDFTWRVRGRPKDAKCRPRMVLVDSTPALGRADHTQSRNRVISSDVPSATRTNSTAAGTRGWCSYFAPTLLDPSPIEQCRCGPTDPRRVFPPVCLRAPPSTPAAASASLSAIFRPLGYVHELRLYVASSRKRQRAFASSICRGVRQNTRTSSGLETRTARHRAREVATFSRRRS